MAFASIDVSQSPAGRRAVVAPAVADEPAVVTAGADGLAGLEAKWREVSALSRDAAAFMSFGYALAAARYHERRGESVLTAVVDWAGRPAAIVSVALVRRAGVTTAVALGDPVTQYSDALLAGDAPQRLVAAALRAIARTGGVDLFEFRRVRADAPLAAALSVFGATETARAEAPFADLSAADDVQALLLAVAGAKHRRERARSRRRLAERGELRFEAFRGEAAVAPLAEAFRIKAERLAGAGLYSRVIGDPDALALFQAAARDPEDGASVVAAQLTVGGEVAAFEVGLVRGRRFHAYLGATTEDFASGSPGKVLMEDALGWAKAEGLEVYDLLSPADRYKREWSTGATIVRDLVAPVTLKGRLYAGPWTRLRPLLRGALQRLPAPLRRIAMRAATGAGAR